MAYMEPRFGLGRQLYLAADREGFQAVATMGGRVNSLSVSLAEVLQRSTRTADEINQLSGEVAESVIEDLVQAFIDFTVPAFMDYMSQIPFLRGLSLRQIINGRVLVSFELENGVEAYEDGRDFQFISPMMEIPQMERGQEVEGVLSDFFTELFEALLALKETAEAYERYMRIYPATRLIMYVFVMGPGAPLRGNPLSASKFHAEMDARVKASSVLAQKGHFRFIERNEKTKDCVPRALAHALVDQAVDHYAGRFNVEWNMLEALNYDLYFMQPRANVRFRRRKERDSGIWEPFVEDLVLALCEMGQVRHGQDWCLEDISALVDTVNERLEDKMWVVYLMDMQGDQQGVSFAFPTEADARTRFTDEKTLQVTLAINGNHVHQLRSRDPGLILRRQHIPGFPQHLKHHDLCRRCLLPYHKKRSSHYCTLLYNENQSQPQCKQCQGSCWTSREGLERVRPRLPCDDCDGRFYNEECLKNHQSTCSLYFWCFECTGLGIKLRKSTYHTLGKWHDGVAKEGWRLHECSDQFCKPCNQHMRRGHSCYWSRKTALVPYAPCSAENCQEVGYYIPSEYGMKKQAYEHKRFDRTQNAIRQVIRERDTGKKAWQLGFCEAHHEPEKHVRSDFEKICYYDLETMVVTDRDLRFPPAEGEEKKLQYQVNLVVMQHADGSEPKVFYSLEAFMEHVLTAKHKEYGDFFYGGWTFVAHNAASFDLKFVVKYCLEQGLEMQPMTTGRKTRQLILPLKTPNARVKRAFSKSQEAPTADKYRTITWIDSYAFLPFALSRFGKAFGLSQGKGDFPHLFNVPANQKVVLDHHPPLEYYNPQDKKPESYLALTQWYETVKNKPFDFQKELVRYCKQDVEVLRQGCTAFIEAFIAKNFLHPFSYLTIASACMAAYQQNNVPAETVRYYRRGGAIRSSKAARLFFKQISFLVQKLARGETVKGHDHGLPDDLPLDAESWAEVQYEAQIPNTRYYVDALLPSRRTVVEFNGCYFHGHGCQSKAPQHPAKSEAANRAVFTHKKNMTEKLKKTGQRRDRIMQAGYRVVMVWECEMKAFMKLKLGEDFVLPELPPHRLNVREHLHGGRTEAFGLSCEIRDMDQVSLHYYDITSLYPFVNLTCKYPVGSVTVYLGLGDAYKQDDELETVVRVERLALPETDWCGFAYVRILPPRGLDMPVLPYSIGNPPKLFFGLCRTCMEKAGQAETTAELPQGRCRHSEAQRAFICMLTNMDAELALEKGYRILNVYELRLYEASSSDLFKEYMQANVLLKLQSSPRPDNVQEVIEAYASEFDIHLRAEDIQPNPAQRELAKLMINSLWGKCAERMNFVEKKICHSFEEVRGVLNRHREGFKGVEHWTELPNVCVLTYQQDRDTVQQPKAYQHPHLACFTTSMARVHLYRTSLGYLHPSQVLYADTDSVVFVYDRQNPYHKKMDCSKGYLLGEYKDELGAGERMKRFYALAPKTYAYEHTISEAKQAEIEQEPDRLRRQLKRQNATECVKMKGFSLSTEMAMQCNVDGFKKMVLGEQECFVQDRPYAIGRSAQMNVPLVQREKKVLRNPLYVKRRILPTIEWGTYTLTPSEPWGY
eukprot:CFRG8234T1